MAHAFLEEQVHALAKMCEALICHIHYHADGEAEGHVGYPGIACPVEVCKRYAEALHELNFGLIYERAGELASKLEDMNDEIERLKSARGLYTKQEQEEADVE